VGKSDYVGSHLFFNQAPPPPNFHSFPAGSKNLLMAVSPFNNNLPEHNFIIPYDTLIVFPNAALHHFLK